MPRPAYTESENDKIRQHLAEGALELFREQGIEQLSLRKLAQRMGISHTKLYRYFHNKEALLVTVRMASLEILYRMLTQNDPVTADPITRLRIAGGTLRDFAKKYPKEYHFLFSATQLADEEDLPLLRLRHMVFNYVVDMAEQARREGLIESDARTLVNLAWSLLHGAISLNDNNQLLEGRSFDDLMDHALTLLFGAAPARQRQASPARLPRRRAAGAESDR